MHLDLRAIAQDVRKAETEDLLDRVTVYRCDMEEAALDLIVGELSRRGVGPKEIDKHERGRRAAALLRPDGSVERCTFCFRPAVVRAWGWKFLVHWELGLIPMPLFLFPRLRRYCVDHAREHGKALPPTGEDTQ